MHRPTISLTRFDRVQIALNTRVIGHTRLYDFDAVLDDTGAFSVPQARRSPGGAAPAQASA